MRDVKSDEMLLLFEEINRSHFFQIVTLKSSSTKFSAKTQAKRV